VAVSHGAVSLVAAVVKGIVNGPCRERETLRSPLSGVHELRGGQSEPLRYAHGEGHICHLRGPEISQSAGRTTDLLREFGPGQSQFLTSPIERGMQLVQIPPEPACGARLRKPDIAHVDDRSGKELLRRPTKPAQYEHCVLAGGLTARAQTGDRSTAERMIINSVCVEVRGLLPQLISELVPAQAVIAACRVEGGEERHEVENGQIRHSREDTRN
jgi:hypothetical protein